MAGSISHVIFAEKLLATRFNSKSEVAFILGNLFPDIRYLNVIDRDATHSKGVTLEMIAKEADDFKAGILLHSYIDEKREDYVENSGIYSIYPKTHATSVAMKLCEDIYLYPRSKKWDIYMQYLSKATDQEKSMNVPDDAINEWHRINANYFADPKLSNAPIFLGGLGFDNAQIREVLEICDTIQETDDVSSCINSFYQTLH